MKWYGIIDKHEITFPIASRNVNDLAGLKSEYETRYNELGLIIDYVGVLTDLIFYCQTRHCSLAAMSVLEMML